MWCVRVARFSTRSIWESLPRAGAAPQLLTRHAKRATTSAMGDQQDRDQAPRAALPPIERAIRYLPLIAISNFLIAVPAFALSIAVAYFTFIQADATTKMQIASVWPYVAFETSNRNDQDDPFILLSLTNKGVGPAHIRGLEVRYRDKPYTQFREVLGACCSDSPETLSVGIGSMLGEVLRPGENVMFAQLDPQKVPAETWSRFDEERLKLKVRICYCSVFEDCWVADSSSDRATPVKQCPADWHQFYGSAELSKLRN